MCDPVTLMAVGTGVSVLGGLQQASAQAANDRYQQQVSRDNAAILGTKITEQQYQNKVEEQRVMERGTTAISDTRASYAAGNKDLTYGSPLDMILQTTTRAAQDAQMAKYNGDLRVADIQTQRTNAINQASADGAAASNATTAGFITGVGTAINGAAGIARYQASIQ